MSGFFNSKIDTASVTAQINTVNAQLTEKAKEINALAKATGNVLDDNKYPRINPETSDSGRIQRFFNDSVGKIAVIPAGLYPSTVELVLPVGVQLVMHKDAIIQAVSAMNSVLTTPLDVFHREGFISGGVLDANHFAKNGLHLKYIKNFYVENTKVKKANEIMFKFGATGTPELNYGVYAFNIVGDRLGGATMPAGSIGLTFENCGDSKLINPLMIGNEIGFKLSSSNNEIINAHAWNYPSNGAMRKGFDITGMSNFLSSCYADTPSEYGFHIQNYNNFLIGCKIYINSSTLGLDNTVIGVQVEPTGQYSSVIGCFFFGTDATHRMAKDFGGTLTNVTIMGCQTSNVVTTTKSKLPPLLPITVDSFTTTASGDGVEVAKFQIERSWRMVQKGAGSAASLMFQPGSANKTMGVLSFDGTYALEIEANDDVSGPSRGKIDGKYIVNVRNGTVNPNSVVTPDFVGQDYIDTVAKIGYKACGTGNTDWKQTTN